MFILKILFDFSLVSFFKGISNFMDYLMSKPFLLKNSSIKPFSIRSKVNIIDLLIMKLQSRMLSTIQQRFYHPKIKSKTTAYPYKKKRNVARLNK